MIQRVKRYTLLTVKSLGTHSLHAILYSFEVIRGGYCVKLFTHPLTRVHHLGAAFEFSTRSDC